MTTLEGARRPWPRRKLLTAMVLVLLAGGTLFLGQLREAGVGTPLDPAALLLRVLGLGLAVRAVSLVVLAVPWLRLASGAQRFRLTLTEEEIVLNDGERKETGQLQDLLTVVEEGDWQRRPAGRRNTFVYALLAGTRAQPYLTIPPVFADTPGSIAERLMRSGQPAPFPATEEELPSRTYQRATRGDLDPHTIAVRHGRGWLRRGPYASSLLLIALIDGFARSGVAILDAPVLVVVVLGLLLIPLGWIFLTLRAMRSRQGLAMVLTPRYLLLRSRGGVIATEWDEIKKVRVAERMSWSILGGLEAARTLVIERSARDSDIRYQDAYLGLPIEAAKGLLESYRQRAHLS
ncbi:MAG: hypothetical protein AAGF12_04320 [Myxococcota bacterium]